jgi:hypothetical protein
MSTFSRPRIPQNDRNLAATFVGVFGAPDLADISVMTMRRVGLCEMALGFLIFLSFLGEERGGEDAGGAVADEEEFVEECVSDIF